MKRYIVQSGTTDKISEYNINGELIDIMYANGKTETVPYSSETITYMDELMFQQYKDFDIDMALLLDNHEMGVSAGAGALTMAAYLMTSGSDDNSLLMATAVGMGTTVALEIFHKIAREEEITEDYRKDRALVENYDVLSAVVNNDETYNSLSEHVKDELKSVHDGTIPLSINSIRNLRIQDISKMLWVYNNSKIPKKRVR